MSGKIRLSTAHSLLLSVRATTFAPRNGIFSSVLMSLKEQKCASGEGVVSEKSTRRNGKEAKLQSSSNLSMMVGVNKLELPSLIVIL